MIVTAEIRNRDKSAGFVKISKFENGRVNRMTLSPEDAQLFYHLWLPLLDFTNRKYHINPRLKKITKASELHPADAKEIANKLWENVTIIDAYLKGAPDLPKEHQAIIRGWKRRIYGRFIVERHLKKGSIFISVENEKIYQVSGIISTWEEMFSGLPLPLLVDAVLIPFLGVIISDGLVASYNLVIGKNMRQSFKELYMTAKKGGRIHRSL